MTGALHSIQPRIIVVLEGGYNIPAIQHGMHAVVATLLGVASPAQPLLSAAANAARKDIMSTVEVMRPFWPTLQ